MADIAAEVVLRRLQAGAEQIACIKVHGNLPLGKGLHDFVQRANVGRDAGVAAAEVVQVNEQITLALARAHGVQVKAAIGAAIELGGIGNAVAIAVAHTGCHIVDAAGGGEVHGAPVTGGMGLGKARKRTHDGRVVVGGAVGQGDHCRPGPCTGRGGLGCAAAKAHKVHRRTIADQFCKAVEALPVRGLLAGIGDIDMVASVLQIGAGLRTNDEVAVVRQCELRQGKAHAVTDGLSAKIDGGCAQAVLAQVHRCAGVVVNLQPADGVAVHIAGDFADEQA